MNPAVVEAPPPRPPFQLAFDSDTAAPLWETEAFHAWATDCPPGNVQPTVHPAIGDVPVLVTTTSPWKPPGQELATR